MKRLKARARSLVFLLCSLTAAGRLMAQGTAFTYQGQLYGSGGPATGLYDFTFTLYPTNVTGSPVAGPVTNSATAVTNGLFTTLVDFGPGAFTGTSNWLEIAVRTNGAGSFFTLAPRQQLAPTPYALVAGSLPGLTVQENGAIAPNLIGGSANNFVTSGAIGATIGGGGATLITVGPHIYHYTNSVTGSFGTVGGGAVNTAAGLATVSGGQNNSASGAWATVGGGLGNNATGGFSVVGGGQENLASGDSSSGDATVAGGFQNVAGANDATVGGGFNNLATNTFATVPGGADNVAGGQSSFAAGNNAQALHQGAFVWADAEFPPFASTTTNQFSVRANGGVNLVPGSAGVAITTGAGTVQVSSEPDNVVPSLIVTNNNSYSGHLRFRNYLEVQPNLAGTAPGGLDVRNTSGAATIVMNGANGNITASTFTGSGVGLTTLLAPNLLGSVPASALTSVPAGNLTGTAAASVLGVTGSWTPTIGDGTNNFPLTTQTGYFEKIGNLVYVEIWLQWAQPPAGVQEPADLFTPNLLKVSLPFPVASRRAVFTVGNSLNLATPPLSALASQGDSYLHFEYQIRNWSYFVSFINGVQTYNGPSDLIAPDYSLISTNVAMKDYVFQFGGELQVTGFYRWQ